MSYNIISWFGLLSEDRNKRPYSFDTFLKEYTYKKSYIRTLDILNFYPLQFQRNRIMSLIRGYDEIKI